MKSPEECENISEVRQGIDIVDQEIMKLFGLRFKYVKEVVKYKSPDKDSIVAADRRQAVLNERRRLAVENGLDPDVFEEIYRKLISHFIEEELKIVNNRTK